MPTPKKKAANSGPTPVETILHGDKRTNIPTADAQDFLAPEVEAPQRLLYPRQPELDPQLVWKGKDSQDEDGEFEVDAPPIYIQEKIDPRVLIENLRATSKAGEIEPELTLFDTFDGLDEMESVEYYQHDANWSNRMILGDSLQVMASLAEREALRGKVQMIYIDPPYGIKFGSNWQGRVDRRDVKDGKIEDISREVEQIKAFRDTWELGIHSYLSYLRDRLTAAKDLLTESGSCFVQIGDENVHLVRSLMDEVFGSENWITTICFTKTSSSTSPFLGGTSDYIVWFASNASRMKYRSLFNHKSRGGVGSGSYTRVELSDGTRRAMSGTERTDPEVSSSGARPYTTSDLTSQAMGRAKGEGAASWFAFELDGATYKPSMQARWKTNEEGMGRLLAARRVEVIGRTPRYVRFIDDFPAFPLAEVWSDVGGATDKTYVVQTSGKIVERCMLMATDPGDLVLDPTCGSGTTAYVAETWGRRWITIDTSRVALALARQRLMGAKFPYYLLADSVEGAKKESDLTATQLPAATPTNDIRHGFVYERVQHITLKSIAQNPDIKEGMSRAEIDAAIKRHADFELLYDKPYENKKKVRVTGPFTTESLSPHRSLAFTAPGQEPKTIAESQAEREAALDASAASFEQSIIANLAKAGVQNGKRNERLTFDSVDTHAGVHIQAVGTVDEPDDGAPRRVGISIGPQYGTVGPSFIKSAAREAIRAGKDDDPETRIDLLCVLGFAFDPTALGSTEDAYASDEGFANVAAERQLGKVPVLLVRMNADLVMGDELKKTGAGNLFTVFGEPDIDVTEVESPSGERQLVVKLRGVDVYDPTTGEVRSDGTGAIALWMIDTNYNEESFFVRHCYFTGGNDPYKRLKTALRADIDEEAWATLYQTESRPFDHPETGKIAVKVINDYGDEVMKVFEIVAV